MGDKTFSVQVKLRVGDEKPKTVDEFQFNPPEDMEQEDVEEQRQDEKKSNSSASVDGDSDVGDGYENVPDRDTEEEGMADKSSSEENLDEMLLNTDQIELKKLSVNLSTEEPHQTFHEAAKYGNVNVVENYLKGFKDDRQDEINGLDYMGRLTALNYAIQYNQIEVVKLLVDANADLNDEDVKSSPLYFAVKYYPKRKDAIIKVKEGFSQRCMLSEKVNIDNLPEDTQGDSIILLLLKNGAKIHGGIPVEFRKKDENLSERNELHYACQKGNTEAAKILMSAGANLMTWDEDGKSPLHLAMLGDGREILQETLDDIDRHGGKLGEWSLESIIDDQTIKGETILHFAIKKNDYDVCSFLIDRGAYVNLCLDDGNSSLHIAASNTDDDIEVASLLLSKGADIDATNEKRETVLHKAAQFNTFRIADFLLEQGCDVNAFDRNLQTPLHIAAQAGHKETVEVLLQNNPDVSMLDKYDKSAMYYAIIENQIEIVKQLLGYITTSSNSAGLMGQLFESGNSFLHIAAVNGKPEITALLLEYGEDADVSNDEGETPLHLACQNGCIKVVKILLEQKETNIYQRTLDDETAINYAVSNDHEKIVELFITTIKYDLKKETTLELLYYACTNDFGKSVSLLLDSGASVNSRLSNSEDTPLHNAAWCGSLNVLKVLFAYNADVTLRDKDGWNALNWAIEYSQREVVLELLNHRDWRKMMENHYVDGHELASPMRQLIEKFPDIAHMVLNECMSLKASPRDAEDEDCNMTFNYELINDTYSKWIPTNFEGRRRSSIQRIQNLVRGEKKQVGTLLKEKKHHPLSIMCRFQQSELLKHPVVLSLISDKWMKFGRYVFFGRFLLYALFLFFLTGFIIISTELLPQGVKKTNGVITCSRSSIADEDSGIVIFFFFIGKYIVIVMSCFQLLLEVIQLISGGFSYMQDLTNWVEAPLYILSITFASLPYDRLTDTTVCSKVIHISYGACAIFLAWINLLLFIQKLPRYGIFVVMFIHVTKTFLKFFLTFALFIIAFGLAFFLLLGQQSQAFTNSGHSFMKTIVMMIGEFDFDNIFNSDSTKPPAVTWLFFFLLVIVLTILLTNVMVGLAVDDIKGVLEMAEFNRKEMMINFILESENILRVAFKRTFDEKEKIIYPNRDFTWFQQLFMSHIITMKEIRQAQKTGKVKRKRDDSKEEDVPELQSEEEIDRLRNLEGNGMKHQLESVQNDSRELKKHIKNIEKIMQQLLDQ